jgi:hypothetical protein
LERREGNWELAGSNSRRKNSRGVVGRGGWRIPVSGPVIRRELGLMSAPSRDITRRIQAIL